MKLIVPVLPMAMMGMLLGSGSAAQGEERKAKNSAEQEAFLSRRTSGVMMGTFGSYGGLLYSVSDVIVHTESDEINGTRLSSPFPDFYKPTWRELFDAVARQTKSTWKYDATRDYWVFGGPPQSPRFDITIAEDWKTHDEGLYIGYQPSSAPVGMDVYVLGRYSVTNQAEEEALFRRIKEAIAVRLAANFKQDVSAREMTDVAIGKLQALHFQITAPTGIIWRQWVVVDSGMAFAIVSAIKPEDEKAILPDVLKMVASFKVLGEVGKSERGDAANGSQANRSETNRTSSAPGTNR